MKIKLSSKNYQPWLMLVGRSLLFLAFQALIAVIYLLTGSPTAWNDSAAWWPFAIIFTNLVCLFALIHFYRQEQSKFWDVFRIDRKAMKKDLLFLLGFMVIAGPLGYLPNILSAKWLFGDPQIALDLLVRPLPAWGAIAAFLFFPLLQGLVEIPTYMLYVLPHLEKQGVRPWAAVSLASLFLAAQHIFAPFLPNLDFIMYRFVMFLPFAVLIALVMRSRPRLMPYIAVIHVLMDLSIAVMFLLEMR
ncbi:MAG: hypothetical protein JW750_07710 [Anaerolineaceae bacterium]|nr:hypothetical protein [Anaerolineaceae bacterium]